MNKQLIFLSFGILLILMVTTVENANVLYNNDKRDFIGEEVIIMKFLLKIPWACMFNHY